MYETLFQNVIKVLPTIYKNKLKMPRNNRKGLFLECKLFEYNFWENYLEFSDKVNPPIRVAKFSNAKHRYAFFLKSGDIFLLLWPC